MTDDATGTTFSVSGVARGDTEAMRARDRFQEEWAAGVRLVGETPRERLAWAMKFVQGNPRALSAGERLNDQLALAAFEGQGSGGTITRWTDRWGNRDLHKPTPAETDKAREQMARVLRAVVRREAVKVGPITSTERLEWNSQQGRFYLWQTVGTSWSERPVLALNRLIVDHGHLVKECPAPAVRAKAGETCGVWFVANRPKQEYCSARCQTRAATRAYREENPGRRPQGKTRRTR